MWHPTDYFDLTSFEYADLFEEVEYVWDVLSRLEAYLVAQTPWEPGIHGTVSPGAYLVGHHILIEEHAVVEAGAYLEGPCLIGRGCVVRHGAYIRAGTLAGAGSLIGHATETKNAILLPQSKAAHFAYVGDSILGHRVNLGAGTKLANRRLDGGPITLKMTLTVQSTGREKLGAILGDDCQLGCNCVCNPGTLLGPGCTVYPLTAVHGYHTAQTVLKPLSAS